MIKNSINNKIYIGSTIKSFKLRFSAHINLLKSNKHDNSLLQNAWNKYGENNFKFNIVESFEDIESYELLYLEKLYIHYYNTFNKDVGYNICRVGKSRIGTKWSDESRKKRCGDGNPMFGKGDSRKGILNPMFGKSLTELHKSKMSKSLTGLKKPVTGEKLSKPVIMLDTQNKVLCEFSSYTEAMDKTNILHISEVCNNKRKTAGGYIWKWK